MRLSSVNLASLTLFVAIILTPWLAYSGAYRLDPGSQAWVDVDGRGYTTIYVRNLEQGTGRLRFPEQYGTVEVGPSHEIELHWRALGPAIRVENIGTTRVEVISRYMDRPRFTP